MARKPDNDDEQVAQIDALLQHFRKIQQDTARILTSLETERDLAARKTNGTSKKKR